MSDREKVIKELEERIKVAEECMGNPMFTPDAIRTIVALLKEKEILRCKDCIYYRQDKWCNEHGREVKKTDYCSFGEPEGR